MKKLSLLPLMFAVLASAAIAVDKVGESCPQTGHRVSQVGDEVLSCVDGKWKHTGHVGTTLVTLGVQLMDGDKRLTSTTVTALDGQPVSVSAGTVKDNFSMMMTMTPTKDGKIAVEFSANKSEVTAIQNFKQGDLEEQLPQEATTFLKKKLALESGKEVVIPFGPFVETNKPARTQYTLKLVATKG